MGEGGGNIREQDSTFFPSVNRCHTQLCNVESFLLLHLDFSVFFLRTDCHRDTHCGFVLGLGWFFGFLFFYFLNKPLIPVL